MEKSKIYSQVRRGDIFYYYDENKKSAKGSVQCGSRPVIILSNDIGNTCSTTVIVTFLTSNLEKNPLPTHVCINSAQIPSIALLEQIKTISKSSLRGYMGHISEDEEKQINKALSISLEASVDMRSISDSDLNYLISARQNCNIQERYQLNKIIKTVNSINASKELVNTYVENRFEGYLDQRAIKRIKQAINQEVRAAHKRQIKLGKRLIQGTNDEKDGERSYKRDNKMCNQIERKSKSRKRIHRVDVNHVENNINSDSAPQRMYGI